MARKALLHGAAFAVTAAVLSGCSSSPSYPHAWCGPMIMQFHGHETQSAYMAGLASLQRSGAPVAKLAADVSAYEHDMAVASVPGTAGFGDLASAPKALGKVTVDLQQLNAECGQNADAWKTDDI